MFTVLKTLFRRPAMAPLTVLAYGAVLIGLAWVTAVEIGVSARRPLGLM